MQQNLRKDPEPGTRWEAAKNMSSLSTSVPSLFSANQLSLCLVHVVKQLLGFLVQVYPRGSSVETTVK